MGGSEVMLWTAMPAPPLGSPPGFMLLRGSPTWQPDAGALLQPPSHTSWTVGACPCSTIPSCVTLGKLLSLSVPHVRISKRGCYGPFLKVDCEN